MSRGFQQNRKGEWAPFDDDFTPPGIARELHVRPAYSLDLGMTAGSYILLSPQERDEAVAEIKRLRTALRTARDLIEAALHPDAE